MVTAAAAALALGRMSISARASALIGQWHGPRLSRRTRRRGRGFEHRLRRSDEGSIVIECVAWAGMRNGEMAEKAFTLRLASMPQRPLGPTKCWTEETQAGSVAPHPRSSLPQM